MSEQGHRKTIYVVIISLFSKAITLLSNTIYLAMFGAANPALNVYVYVLGIPNVIFNCIGTALNTVVIPIYTSTLAKNDAPAAKKFLDDIISISMAIIAALVVMGIIAAPLIADNALGAIGMEYKDYMVFALRTLLPVMVFYGLNYIFQGILQSHGQFKLPAFVSAPTGLIIIAYMLLFSKRWGVTGLIVATVLGLLAQPLIMLPGIWKTGYKYGFSFDLKSPNIRTAAALTVPVLASVSSYQVNFLFNNTMALRFGTVTLMTYSQQLVQTFMLTIVYAVTSVYFPRLSSLWAADEKEDYGKTLQSLIEYMFFLILPCACGFLVLRYGIMDFLLNWKDQSDSNIVMAGNLLGIYSAGIIAISFKEVLDKAFYSAKDTKTPALCGFLIMAVNIAATFALLKYLGPYSMAVAYVISAFCGVLVLFVKVNGIVKITDGQFFVSLIKTVLATILMVIAASFGVKFSKDIYALNDTFTKIVQLVIPATIGASVYFITAYLLKIPAFYGKLVFGRQGNENNPKT